MRRRDTRQRLVQAAADLMSQKGFRSASVDELCERAGVRKGSFYHFFPTKTDLALAALDLQWTAVRQRVFDAVDGSEAPGLERLRRLGERTDALQRQEWADRRVMGSQIGALGQEMAGHDERIRDAVHGIFQAQCQYVRRWLDEAVEQREVTSGDNDARARSILALFEGARLLSRVAADPEVFQQAFAAVSAVTGRLPPPVRPAPGTAPELS